MLGVVLTIAGGVVAGGLFLLFVAGFAFLLFGMLSRLDRHQSRLGAAEDRLAALERRQDRCA